MKRIIALLLVILSITMIFSGCQGGKQKLYVFNWGGYMHPEVISLFEKEFDVKIVYETYEDNESMYPKVKNSTEAFDIVFPSEYMVEQMIREDLLYPINLDNIPNIQYIEERFLDLGYDPNNQYSVPYMWGTLGILYNTTMVDDVVDSWEILWNPKYSNNILMTNSLRDAFTVPLKLLGYSINTTDETELEEAKQLLIQQKPLVQGYFIDQIRDKMVNEEAALSVIWNGDAIFTREENPDLAYVVPKEGSNVWLDSAVIPKTSKNKELAEQFINFLNRPDIALMNTEYIGYSTPHKAAREQLDEELRNDPAAYPSDEILDRCEVFIDLQDAREMYNQKWKEVKAD